MTHHRKVCVHGVQLEVDLLVDPIFAFTVVELAHLRLGHLFFSFKKSSSSSSSSRVYEQSLTVIVLKEARLPVQSLLQLSNWRNDKDGPFYVALPFPYVTYDLIGPVGKSHDKKPKCACVILLSLRSYD